MKINKLFNKAVFIFAFFVGVFLNLNANVCYGNPVGEIFSLKNVYATKSKNSDSYFIWFKFNKKPENIVKKIVLKSYSLELAFKNSYTGNGHKFIKFHNNGLFKAVEIIPDKNSGFDALIYFNKNIKVNKKDAYATYYGSYFVVRINHSFPENLFKDVGIKSSLKKVAAKQAVKDALPAAAHASSAVLKRHNIAIKTKTSKKNLQGALNLSANNAPKLNMGFEAVKTAVYLALIIGLIYGIYFLMNRFKNRISVKERLNNLKIVSAINLGNKKSILLIEVNKEFFLVGVSQSNIQVMGHLNSETVKSEALNSEVKDEKQEDDIFASKPNKTSDKFADVLREQVNKPADISVSEPYFKAKTEQYKNMNQSMDLNSNSAAIPDNFKVKNIYEAKFKNKADSVFFDIEERLKGLMENTDYTGKGASNGHSKKI